MSDTMTEGVIAKWHKKVGDKVGSGDLIAEVETDKATMDFESYQEGTLLYIGPKEGEAVPVDAVIAVLGEEGEDYQTLLDEEGEGNGGGSSEADTDKSDGGDSKHEEETAERESTGTEVNIENMNAQVRPMTQPSEKMKQ